MNHTGVAEIQNGEIRLARYRLSSLFPAIGYFKHTFWQAIAAARHSYKV